MVRPLGAKALDSLLTPMLRSSGPGSRKRGERTDGAHDLVHQASHGRHTVWGLTTSEDRGARDIPRCPVDPGTLAKILAFNPGAAARSRSPSRRLATTSLHAGLLVGGNDVVLGAPSHLRSQRSGMGPAWGAKFGSRGKIQLRCCQGTGMAAEPAPRGGEADLGDQTL